MALDDKLICEAGMEAAGLTKNDEGVYVAGAFIKDVEAAPESAEMS